MTMYLIRKWNEYMGPKDERLEAEENKSMKVASYILLVGSTMSLYYWIMVNQVANTTDHPVLTPLGASVVPVDLLLILTILAAGFASVGMQIRGGAFSSYKRYAEVDRIPWDYVASFALFCGAVLGVLTCGMRILAEIQIVGIENVAWFGDLAIGVLLHGLRRRLCCHLPHHQRCHQASPPARRRAPGLTKCDSS